ncbi:MAG TPA: hypothetical protein VHM26_03885 [Chitinophagaceae bacterium]|nr:hypothetical protein [Chitinophagaceae bacterium]
MRRYLIIAGCFIAGLSPAGFVKAQGVSIPDTIVIPRGYEPEFRRQINHNAIDAEQKGILASDGVNDPFFSPTANEEVNIMLTRVLTRKVDQLQYMIETDKGFDHRLKVNYLKGLENVLKNFKQNWKARNAKRANPVRFPEVLMAYARCMDADRKGLSIEPIVRELPYDVATIVVNANIFDKNPGYDNSRNELVLKYCLLHPEQTFQTLRDNPAVPFADSMVRVVSQQYPRQLYDYSQASNKLALIIRNINNDVFIKSIARMARSKDGQQYFPFLDNIVKGKMDFASIDSVKNDSIKYYKLLVKTQMDYVERAINKDTAFEFKALTSKLETKAKETFVNVINGLHNENDVIRYRVIQPLNAEELYYLAVSTDGLIYTSSFVKGVYPLMMKKINNRGDSLLKRLNFDRYRKFIKMTAGYNTLANFLASFPNQEDANNLMRAFVGRLERSNGLEDGVDVADSYASIAESIKPMAKEMLVNVQRNYERNLAENNKKGIAMYNILQKLFLSADSTNKIDLTKELGIPPVYEVPYKSMANDSGRVIMQVFFYGDKDGQGIFTGFQNMFANSNWKIDRSNPQWVTITSVKGKPVSIYANRPLDENTGEDEKAQEALGAYLEKNKYNPTITIHRGHSYYAPYTIQQMAASSRIVFLGSCGGYHLIHDVLEKAPEAHIIASKQIGRTAINKPFFDLLTEKARNGSNVDWIPFWKEFEKRANVEGFEDYIPPYENLGALFIKAYKIAMGDEGEQKAF